ncbi:MAG: hypothetical protein H0U29_07000, partial [Acidimicrobiia bacterium]|nr:hypothetical protein [Acidimicrobiia bacterium]
MSTNRTHRTRTRVIAGLVALAAGTVGIAGCRTAPAGLTVSTAVGSLNRPWDIAFTPGRGMLFTEKVGRIK